MAESLTALCREAIQSVAQIGNNAVLTETERKVMEDRIEREKQQKRNDALARERSANTYQTRVKWTEGLLWWSWARCSPIYPRRYRMATEVKMFASIPETISPEQCTRKSGELRKLMDSQAHWCGKESQFIGIQTFLADLKVKETP